MDRRYYPSIIMLLLLVKQYKSACPGTNTSIPKEYFLSFSPRMKDAHNQWCSGHFLFRSVLITCFWPLPSNDWKSRLCCFFFWFFFPSCFPPFIMWMFSVKDQESLKGRGELSMFLKLCIPTSFWNLRVWRTFSLTQLSV